jgi:replicative DNA helicase
LPQRSDFFLSFSFSVCFEGVPQYGMYLFVIDSLQLLHSTARRAENRQQETADVSSGIKAWARELSVPVIMLSQLERE